MSTRNLGRLHPIAVHFHGGATADAGLGCALRKKKKKWCLLTPGLVLLLGFSAAAYAQVTSKVLFHTDRDGNDEIYIAIDNGANQTNLTKCPGVNCPGVTSSSDEYPAFCGNLIVFSSDRDGNPGKFDVFKMKTDGTGPTNLTPNTVNSNEHEPNCSVLLGVTWVVFRSDMDGNDEIYKVKIDGSGLQRLTNNSVSDENPTWCGNDILFTRDEGAPQANPPFDYQLYMMSADGTNERALTCTPDPCPAGPGCGSFQTAHEFYWPVCHLNHPTLENQVAFDATSHAAYGGTRQIYRMPLCGSGCCLSDINQATLLTTGGGDNRTASWSPGGLFIAFASSRLSVNPMDGTTDYEIYKMDDEFGDRTLLGSLSQLTGGDGQQTDDEDPHWGEVKP